MKRLITAQDYILNAIIHAEEYVARVKATVNPKYHSDYNTDVFNVAWRAFLGNGKLSVDPTRFIHFDPISVKNYIALKNAGTSMA